VHCPNKARFIKDILEHPPNTQSILMKVIEMVDARIENIMEIKEILEKVEELEI
jgi:DNA repair ATPase RecN